MTTGDTDYRAEMPDAISKSSRRNLRGYETGVSNVPAGREHFCPEAQQMMEAVVERENMTVALRRVMANKGSAGINKMSVESLTPYLRQALATHQRGPADRPVRTESRKTCRNSQAWGHRDATAGHPHGNRSTHPTGDPSGHAADLRPGLFRIELRLPPWPQYTPGRATSTSPCGLWPGGQPRLLSDFVQSSQPSQGRLY